VKRYHVGILLELPLDVGGGFQQSLSFRDIALAGEGWAFKEIGDRLEGKAVQPLEHQEDDRHDNINQFTEAELTAMLRSRLKNVPVETDEQRPEGEPLN
jgi:hypothetical protein